jgi:hypothetical protein
MAAASLELITAMYGFAKAAKPITGRGVGYKLFAHHLISSMGDDMRKVYRLLKEARERGIIPWEWIVDDARALERVSSWENPAEFAETVVRAYRKDRWSQQPVRVEVWSEKGTVRGVIAPITDKYGVGFRNVIGYSGSTPVHDVSVSDDSPLIILYVGDYDPSGMNMSEHDLPKRFAKYGGTHITIKRIALRREHLADLPSFPASDKRKDPRYPWFVRSYGDQCWELDALDPNALRKMVEKAIKAHIFDTAAWKRCEVVEKAERESIRIGVRGWGRSC